MMKKIVRMKKSETFDVKTRQQVKPRATTAPTHMFEKQVAENLQLSRTKSSTITSTTETPGLHRKRQDDAGPQISTQRFQHFHRLDSYPLDWTYNSPPCMSQGTPKPSYSVTTARPRVG